MTQEKFLLIWEQNDRSTEVLIGNGGCRTSKQHIALNAKGLRVLMCDARNPNPNGEAGPMFLVSEGVERVYREYDDYRFETLPDRKIKTSRRHWVMIQRKMLSQRYGAQISTLPKSLVRLMRKKAR